MVEDPLENDIVHVKELFLIKNFHKCLVLSFVNILSCHMFISGDDD